MEDEIYEKEQQIEELELIFDYLYLPEEQYKEATIKINKLRKEILDIEIIMNQLETFNSIVNIKNKSQILAEYVQNDFGMMLKDNNITKQQIKESIVDMNKDFDNVINELNMLREQVRSIMEHYSS